MNDARVNGVELPYGYRLMLKPNGQYYWKLGSDCSAWMDDKMHCIFTAYHHADLMTRQAQPKSRSQFIWEKEYCSPTTLDKE